MPPALARWQHGNVQHAGQRPLERAAVVAPPPPDTATSPPAAVACAPHACGARYVPLVLTNTKPQPPAENSDLARKVYAHIKARIASPPAWSDLLGCLVLGCA